MKLLLGALDAIGGFRRRHPVWWRLVTTGVLTCIALFATLHLSSTTNGLLATGAAMSIVILGLSFLTGASGQISLGNGAFMGVGAYATAIWANHHATTPIFAVLLIGALAGAVVGLLIGLPATRLRGPYLAGMTLTFAFAFPSILLAFGSWTAGDAALQLPNIPVAPQWLVDINPSATFFDVNQMFLADVAIVTTGVAFFLMANLFASRTGRAMRLVRDNDVAAELVGVSLPRARVTAFIVSAAYAGLGGALYTLVIGSASGSTYTLGLSITILSLLVIGGIGTLSGALIGGIIFAYSTNWINWLVSKTGIAPSGNLAANLPNIIFGGLLVVTMLAAPFGIAGAVKLGIAKLRPIFERARLQTSEG
jgi:branched-chain amino acid transport system permease protein